MITININYKNNKINNILITGHSGYDVSGKDIVCASVSSIVITSINAILSFDKESINYDLKDDLMVSVKKDTKEVDVLLNNMISLLSELKDQYGKYIKIVKKEN